MNETIGVLGALVAVFVFCLPFILTVATITWLVLAIRAVIHCADHCPNDERVFWFLVILGVPFVGVIIYHRRSPHSTRHHIEQIAQHLPVQPQQTTPTNPPTASPRVPRYASPPNSPDQIAAEVAAAVSKELRHKHESHHRGLYINPGGISAVYTRGRTDQWSQDDGKIIRRKTNETDQN